MSAAASLYIHPAVGHGDRAEVFLDLERRPSVYVAESETDVVAKDQWDIELSATIIFDTPRLTEMSKTGRAICCC
jgi:hypothetical protein